jgi:hypothetical protein
MLGKRQREILERYAKHVSSGEPKTLIITIHPHAYFNREMGGGHGHPITLEMFYDSDGERDGCEWMSSPQTRDSAVKKGQEIARFLCTDLGVSRNIVKLVTAPIPRLKNETQEQV